MIFLEKQRAKKELKQDSQKTALKPVSPDADTLKVEISKVEVVSLKVIPPIDTRKLKAGTPQQEFGTPKSVEKVEPVPRKVETPAKSLKVEVPKVEVPKVEVPKAKVKGVSAAPTPASTPAPTPTITTAITTAPTPAPPAESLKVEVPKVEVKGVSAPTPAPTPASTPAPTIAPTAPTHPHNAVLKVISAGNIFIYEFNDR